MDNSVTLFRVLITGALFLLMSVCLSVSAETADQLETDINAINASRKGLESAIRYLDENGEALRMQKSEIPDEIERKALRSAWYVFLDNIVALDVIGARNNRLYHQAHGAEKEKLFYVSFSAFLTEYRYALEFLQRTEHSPLMHKILNEPMQEFGIPAGTYSEVKFRFLNVLRASEFAWFSVKYKTISISSPLAPLIDNDIKYIMNVDKHGGPGLTAKNAGKVAGDAIFTAWFPIQKGVSEWMGDTKVLRHGKDLITDEQLHDLQPKLQPGDILLVRREWYLSNVGLPGYWPHAALYIGTPEERQAYFSGNKTHEWVISQGEPSGDLEKLLSSRSPQNYLISKQNGNGEIPRVIEAISEGVSFTGIKHAAGGDSLVVLRPRVETEIKARAITRSFEMAGRPYDFDFNFLTDSSIVCTELVYKAYEGEKGLSLPLETVMGRPVLPANRIATLFDEEYAGESRQFEFVAFYDGDERLQRSMESDVDSFRASAYRPKWHIFLPAARTGHQTIADKPGALNSIEERLY